MLDRSMAFYEFAKNTLKAFKKSCHLIRDQGFFLIGSRIFYNLTKF